MHLKLKETRHEDKEQRFKTKGAKYTSKHRTSKKRQISKHLMHIKNNCNFHKKLIIEEKMDIIQHKLQEDIFQTYQTQLGL